MRVLILGGDGYLGWPTALSFSAKGHDVMVVDNYMRRNLMRDNNVEALFSLPDLHERVSLWKKISGKDIEIAIGDCCEYKFLIEVLKKFEPDTIVHYAEIPSAPYSMMGNNEGLLTLKNNIIATATLVYAVLEYSPTAHIIKLGTMGEYGTPDIDIEEGWIEIEHKGRKGRFLYPRAAGSLYHTTKIMDTDLLWFYVRTFGLRVTDLMQGPVYGLVTPETAQDNRLLPHFSYDDIFGTVLNRFIVQAIAGVPLTVYGKGGQTRGYLNLIDTIQCVELAMLNKPEKGELRILNQFTEVFTVNSLAEKVKANGQRIGLDIQIQNLDNPRKELEEHYYNPAYTGLKELGLKPHLLTDEVITDMLLKVNSFKEMIKLKIIMPRVNW